MEAVQEARPIGRRPKFTYAFMEEYVCHEGGGLEEMANLQQAVKQWCTKKKEYLLGDFRSPVYTAHGWHLVGRCVRHETCHQGRGRYFKFVGRSSRDPACYVLTVSTSGECGGAERVMRRSVKAPDAQPSQQDRVDGLRAADDLLSVGLAPTPTNVAVRLGPRQVGASAMRNILRYRRRQYGNATAALVSTQLTFGTGFDQEKIRTLARWRLPAISCNLLFAGS